MSHQNSIRHFTRVATGLAMLGALVAVSAAGPSLPRRENTSGHSAIRLHHEDETTTPTRFMFNYCGDATQPHTVYQRTESLWAEQVADATLLFEVIGRGEVDGNPGTELHGVGRDYYWFVPDAGAAGVWPTLIRQRTSRDAPWGPFQYMLAIERPSDVPQRFFFNYMGDAAARHNMYAREPGTYIEEQTDGTLISTFRVTGRTEVDGNSGTEMKGDGRDFYLFVPDKGATGQWPTLIRMRSSASAWGPFQYIVDGQ